MKKIAILSSHNGSGFEAIYTAINNKELSLEITLLISNNSNSLALENAKRYGLNAQLVNAKTHKNADEEIYKLLVDSKCDFIFLSGYMKKISKEITQKFTILNSHPALLPKYGGKGMYGDFVHEAVLKNNDKVTGVTVHEVNEVYDEGKILLQKELVVLENETISSLATRVKMLEKPTIVEALKQCLK